MNGTHLKIGGRTGIEAGVARHDSLRGIARAVGCSPSTVSNELLARREARKTGGWGGVFNDCALRKSCSARGLCGKPDCERRCSLCPACTDICPGYKKEVCEDLAKPPYVCNGCARRQRCTLEKQVYSAKAAQAAYEATLRSARQGPCIDPEELERVDAIVTPLVKKGQSIHHISCAHRDEIMLSEKTLYNYIGKGLLGADNLDLPRRVRMRPRRPKKPGALKIEKACRQGRSREDYLAFMEANPDARAVQMDTVEGRKGGSVLLTIHFVDAKAMLAFIRPANTARSVTECFNDIYSRIGHECFVKLFPSIATDNGSEFSNPSAIELAPDGTRRTRVFYCDPHASYQKGAIENNHEEIRKVVPKGRPFDGLGQHDIDLLVSHMAGLKKKSLNDKSSYEAFEFLYGEGILEKLGVSRIASDDVCLKPSLLKRGGGA